MPAKRGKATTGMDDGGGRELREFFGRLLSVAPPWEIEGVTINPAAGSVDVAVGFDGEAEFPCPVCDNPLRPSGNVAVKIFRHLDTGPYITYARVRTPILQCPQHGLVHAVSPLGDGQSPFTSAFAGFLADLAGEFSPEQLDRVFRFSREELRVLAIPKSPRAGRKGRTPAASPKTPSVSPPSANQPSASAPTMAPPQGQLPLFQNDGTMELNRGRKALARLDLDGALAAFDQYGARFPGGIVPAFESGLAKTLAEGFAAAPKEPAEAIGYLLSLWRSVEAGAGEIPSSGAAMLARVKKSFHQRMSKLIDGLKETERPHFVESMPVGLIYLEGGRLDKAVEALRATIDAKPGDPALIGYLGDVYYQMGDILTARLCYRDACLVGAAGLDWGRLADEKLVELKEWLRAVKGFNGELSAEWLPSYARLRGLFEPRRIRDLKELEKFIRDYGKLKELFKKGEEPAVAARLFHQCLILCDNEPNLELAGKTSMGQIRADMKAANADAFEEYMSGIVA